MSRTIGVAVVNVKADTSSFYNALDGLGKHGAWSTIGSGISKLGLMAVTAGTAFYTLGKDVIEWGAQTTVQIENATALFKSLTGSEAEAQAMLAKMKEYAINTPFELPGLSNVAAQLLAVGDGFGVTTDNITDYIDILGGATTATGGNDESLQRLVRVLGQMSSSGKVLGQDMNQLAQNLPGFDVWQTLADGVDMSVEELRELQDAGKLDELLTGNEAVMILLGGMMDIPGAADAMTNKMDTLSGSFSKFKETLGFALYDGLQPFFDVLKDVMGDPATMTGLKNLIGIFAELASSLVAELKPVLPVIVVAFGEILKAVTPLAPVVAKVAGLIAKAFIALSPVLAVIVDGIVGLLPAFTQLVEAIMPIVPLIADLLVGAISVLMTLLEPLLPVITELAGMLINSLAAILPTIVTAFQLLAEVLAPVIAALGDGLLTIVEALLPILPSLAELFLAIVEALVPLTPIIVAMVEAFVGALVPVIETLVPLIQLSIDMWTLFAEALAWVIEKISAFALKAIELWTWLYDHTVGKVLEIIQGVIGFFQELYDELVGHSIIPDTVEAILAWWEWLLTPITVAVEAIKAVVVAIWEGLSAAISLIVDGIGLVLSTAWDVIKTVAETAWDLIKTAVMTPIDLLVGLITPIIETITGLFDFTGLADTVLAVWNGIKDAITGPIQEAWEFISETVTKIINAINSVNPFSAGQTLTGIGNALKVPGAAVGEIITHPTLRAVGEGGRPEVIIPLTSPGRAMQLANQSGLTAMLANRGAFGGGPVVSIDNATFQDATDADLVAQRTLVAMQAMVA
jgi:tape measure domain-containing protein